MATPPPFYSLHKSRSILEACYSWYKKQGNLLTDAELAAFETDLSDCDNALLEKRQEDASKLAQKLENFTSTRFKKSPFNYFTELVVALVLALAIAAVVRSMWFEPYEIPTGSMRPTFKEQDHLTVSKTQFGLNIPLQTSHFYFDPKLVERGGIVIWSGDGVALRDTDATYFGIIPYKKRYIKRLIGKPGDILYFYGGKIYGFDKEGNPIEEFLSLPSLDKIDHVPFLRFEGDMTMPTRSTLQFEQMHMPLGRLIFSGGETSGEIYNGREWIKDDPAAMKTPHLQVKTYSDFWGIGNYAMARLLTKEELAQQPNVRLSDVKEAGEGILYLQLIHHPSLTYPKPMSHNDNPFVRLTLTPQMTVLPLQKQHLKAIRDTLYTARFEVVAGKGKRYSVEGSVITATSPSFPGVPDGIYEFYYGTGYQIGWGGNATPLPADHPLYTDDPILLQTLVNLGIDMDTLFSPSSENTYFYPHRYAYFREGSLYLMGGAIVDKEDPVLMKFVENEVKQEKLSTERRPYIAFKDRGAPLKEGTIDRKFIKAFGLEIPPKQYLVLGDNHAMSADSRVFGFLPEENLQGVPEITVWPPSSIGKPNQPPYPLFTIPRMIVWGVACGIALAWFAFHCYRIRRPIFRRVVFRAVN